MVNRMDGRKKKETEVNMFNCSGCNKELHFSATVCPNCGYVIKIVKSKFLAMLVCWFFGVFGMHKFYLSELKKGYSYLTLLIIGLVLFIIGVVMIDKNPANIESASPLLLLGALVLLILSILVVIDFIIIIIMNEKKWAEKYHQ